MTPKSGLGPSGGPEAAKATDPSARRIADADRALTVQISRNVQVTRNWQDGSNHTLPGFANSIVLQQKPWAARREHGGGLLREQGTHQFDRVRFLTGQEFRRVAG